MVRKGLKLIPPGQMDDAAFIMQHGGMLPSLHTHEVQGLCSAILQYLGPSQPDMPPLACTLKQLKARLAACRIGKPAGNCTLSISSIMECHNSRHCIRLQEATRKGLTSRCELIPVKLRLIRWRMPIDKQAHRSRLALCMWH